MDGMTEHILTCSFIHGLPRNVKWTPRASSKMDALSVDQFFLPKVGGSRETLFVDVRRCFKGNGINHWSNDCLNELHDKKKGLGLRNTVRYYRCHIVGYVSRNCPGNERRGIGKYLYLL